MLTRSKIATGTAIFSAAAFAASFTFFCLKKFEQNLTFKSHAVLIPLIIAVVNLVTLALSITAFVYFSKAYSKNKTPEEVSDLYGQHTIENAEYGVQELAESQEQLETTTNELKSLKGQLQEEKNNLEAQVKTIEGNLTTSKEQNAELSKTLEGLEKNQKSLSSTLEEKESRFASLQQQMQEALKLLPANDDHTTQTYLAGEHATGIKGNFASELMEKINKLKGEKEQLQKELTDLQEKGNGPQDNQEMLQQVQTLKAEVEKHEKEINSKKGHNQHLEDKLEALQIQSLNEQLVKLLKDPDAELSEELKKYVDEALEEVVACHQNTINNQRQRLVKLQTELNLKQLDGNIIEEKDKTIQNLQEQLEQLHNQSITIIEARDQSRLISLQEHNDSHSMGTKSRSGSLLSSTFLTESPQKLHSGPNSLASGSFSLTSNSDNYGSLSSNLNSLSSNASAFDPSRTNIGEVVNETYAEKLQENNKKNQALELQVAELTQELREAQSVYTEALEIAEELVTKLTQHESDQEQINFELEEILTILDTNQDPVTENEHNRSREESVSSISSTTDSLSMDGSFSYQSPNDSNVHEANKLLAQSIKSIIENLQQQKIERLTQPNPDTYTIIFPTDSMQYEQEGTPGLNSLTRSDSDLDSGISGTGSGDEEEHNKGETDTSVQVGAPSTSFTVDGVENSVTEFTWCYYSIITPGRH